MKKIICPFCFHKFRTTNVWFRCDNNRCKVKSEDDKLNKFWEENLQKKNTAFQPKGLSLLTSEKAKCPECNEITLKVICPNCHNSLFRDMMRHDSSIISIIGGQSSGKTNYITVLIQELLTKSFTFDAAITVIPCGDVIDANAGGIPYTTEHRYTKDFYNQLYKNKKCHAPTRKNELANRIPLIYRLEIGKNTVRKGKSDFLVFYDTAGENFHSHDEIAKYAQFLKNSAGIIFLLDTFGIDEVNEKMGNNTKNSYKYIFDSIVNYMRDKMTDSERNEFKKKPLALAFSKIDTILNDDTYDISGLNMQINSSFLKDKKVSLNDLFAMHKGINDALLGVWSDPQFLQNVKTGFGEKVCFFGFSALGEMPQNNIVKDIKPYRALDPLVWILYELGYPLPLKKEEKTKIEIKLR